MKKFVLVLISILGCSGQSSHVPIKSFEGVETIEVSVEKIRLPEGFSISNYSFLQGNLSGLYITPNFIDSGNVLLKYDQFSNVCCAKLVGVLNEGKGPLEMPNVSLSGKNYLDESLLFFSSSAQKFIGIDSIGNAKEFKLRDKNISQMGFSVTQSSKYLAYSLQPMRGGAVTNILRIIDLEKGTIVGGVPLRVPIGYEPAIRNQVFSMASVPNGFAVSFVGDRRFFIVDYSGTIKNEIILGESDPIGDPYKISRPQHSASSRPYIYKMEYFDNHLIVLMREGIYLLDGENYSPIKEIKPFFNGEGVSGILDFTIADSTFFYRIGRGDIFRFPYSAIK